MELPRFYPSMTFPPFRTNVPLIGEGLKIRRRVQYWIAPCYFYLMYMGINPLPFYHV